MRRALRQILLARQLPWAKDALFAVDFLNRKARYDRNYVGDFANVPGYSFSRASAAYARTAGGAWMLFASGAPRITDRGYFGEAAATNLALYSRDLTQSGTWVPTNMTTALTATGADGVANAATTLTASAGNATILQTFALASASRIFSLEMRRRSGSGNIQITQDNGSTWTTKTLTTEWQRFDLTQAVLNPVIGIRIVTSGDSIDVDLTQYETITAGNLSSSPIVTTSSTVTRAQDQLVFGIGSLTFAVASAFVAYNRAGHSGITDSLTAMDDGTNNNRVTLSVGTTGAPNVLVTSGAATQADITPSGSTQTGRNKFAARATANDAQACSNGTLGTPDTSVTVPAGSPTRIRMNQGAIFPYIERIAWWNRALTDDELKALTA